MTADEKLVSIILPVYNGADFIAEAIDSVLAQTHKNFELIITDNASTDSTESICRNYFHDSRIKYFRHDKNLGGPLNAAFALSKTAGEFFTMLAHDDALKADFLKTTIDHLAKHPECILISNDWETVDEHGELIRFDKLEKIRPDIPWEKRLRPFFTYPVSKVFFCVYGMMRTSDTKRLFSFKPVKRTQKGLEMATLSRFAVEGEIAALPIILRMYRQHSQSSFNIEVASWKQGSVWKRLKTKFILLQNLYSIRFDQMRVLWGSRYPFLLKARVTSSIYGSYIWLFIQRLFRFPIKMTRKLTSRTFHARVA